MIRKCRYLFLTTVPALLSVSAVFTLYAGEETAAKEKAIVAPGVIEKSAPSYNMHLKDIIAQAEENIRKVDKELEKEEINTRNQEREARVRELFEQGNALNKEGNLKEAREKWRKAIEITKDPEMRGYVEEAKRKAVREDQEKREAARKAEAEAREKARAEEQSRREAGLKAKEVQARSESQTKKEVNDRKAAELEAARAKEAYEREKARLNIEVSDKSDDEDIESAKNTIDSITAKLEQAAAREKARQEELAKRESGSQNTI